MPDKTAAQSGACPIAYPRDLLYRSYIEWCQALLERHFHRITPSTESTTPRRDNGGCTNIQTGPIRGAGSTQLERLGDMINRKPATSLTIGLFIIMSISGLLIFFEFGTGGIRATHEWTSIAFTIAALMHILVHQKPFTRYFKERTVAYILVACMAGGLLYVQSRNDLYAAEETYQQVIHSELSALTPLLGEDISSLKQKLRDMGLTVTDPNQSIYELAELHNKDVHDIIEPLLMSTPQFLISRGS